MAARKKRKAKAPQTETPQSEAPQHEAESPELCIHDATRRGPGGKPTDYRKEYCDIAKRLCEAGATDYELARVLRIHPATLYRWFASHPEFREAVKLGKEPADDRVERSLYHRAVGYDHETLKIMQDKGAPVIVRHIEHVPPDPGAAFNWLKNRRPDQWRDRRELTGAEGGPLEVNSVIEFVDADRK